MPITVWEKIQQAENEVQQHLDNVKDQVDNANAKTSEELTTLHTSLEREFSARQDQSKIDALVSYEKQAKKLELQQAQTKVELLERQNKNAPDIIQSLIVEVKKQYGHR